jgi:hypothetical protein
MGGKCFQEMVKALTEGKNEMVKALTEGKNGSGEKWENHFGASIATSLISVCFGQYGLLGSSCLTHMGVAVDSMSCTPCLKMMQKA